MPFIPSSSGPRRGARRHERRQEAGAEDQVRLEQDKRRPDLPLYLRDFDFAGKASQEVALLPDQTSNDKVSFKPIDAEIRFAGEEDGSYKLEVIADGKLIGAYWMAKDRLHVMTRYQGADGQTYELAEVSRVNYWTRHEK